MRWGVDTWRITDRFLQEWRVRIVPAEQRIGTMPAPGGHRSESPLFHLIFQAFDDTGARCEATARDLLEIYGALTGSRIADALARPTHDPQRRLRGFVHDLNRVMRQAVDTGILTFERYEILWPFPENAEQQEKAEAPPREPPPPAKEVTRLYWTFGPDETPISGKSRHYSDLNLHADTMNYTPGETVEVVIEGADGEPLAEGVSRMTVTLVVGEGGKAKLKDVFKDARVELFAEA